MSAPRGRGAHGGRGGAGGRGGRGGGAGGSSARQAAFGGALTGNGESSSGAPRGPRGSRGRGSVRVAPERHADVTTDRAAVGAAAAAAAAAADAAGKTDADEADLCFICAEPIKLYSIAACNHRTCHICAIRLRALYKKKECTFCKSPIERLIFTSSPDRDFETFEPSELPYSDAKLAIRFETQAAMEETLILLRFNCPEESCEVASAGWSDLKGHVRREHQKMMCDLCIRNKKIFSHEHTLHTHASLNAHIAEEHGHCDFCREHFYSEDELFIHMRDRHEQCHLCKAKGGEEERWRYYKDYNMLEKHFRDSHYLCPAQECMEKKFIVFDSEMDFNSHRVQEHGNELTQRERRDLTRVEANFTYDDATPAAGAAGGSSSRGGRARRGGRGGAVVPDGPSNVAGRAQVPGSGPSRRAAFGGNLTGANGSAPPSGTQTPREDPVTGLSTSNDPAMVERHQMFIARVSSILNDSASRLASFRSAVKTYRAGEMSGRDLADSLHNIIGEVDDGTVVVNGLVDLLDDEGKKRELLSAWNSLRIERTQFPSLTPQAHDGRYAGIAGGQVRSAKASSAAHGQIWANVERAASASSGHRAGKPPALREFPTLRPGGGGSAAIPGSAVHARLANSSLARAAGNRTPWAGAPVSMPSVTSPGTGSAPRPYTVQGRSVAGAAGASSSGKAPPKPSASAFPDLPTNASVAALAAHKRAVLAKGKARANGSAGSTPSGSGTSTPWGTAGGPPSPPVERLDELYASPEIEKASPLARAGMNQRAAEGAGGGGGGGKKKQKQIVMSFGGVHRG